MKQESLFTTGPHQHTPLANRVRPTTLDEFAGQKDLIGPGKVLREIIEHDDLPSLILWGPPGVGKTTLAQIIAHQTHARFVTFSAVTSSIADIRKLMKEAESRREVGEQTIVFIDEIHRFNKSQQDSLLPFVERGTITLIRATTENPSFEINAALLSRCQVFVLHQLTVADISEVITNALHHPNGFPDLKIKISDVTIKEIAEFANGDARSALNLLEMAVNNAPRKGKTVHIDAKVLHRFTATKSLRYDKHDEEHYNLISALHKAIRNSDTDAAVYWCSRMLDGGEDPLFIARRLVRCASEDIGLADPHALELAVSTFQACRFIGMPECDVHLTECVIYLSLAPKSNAVYQARLAAKQDGKKYGNLPVPLVIRNAPTKLMKDLHYGEGYQYAHDTQSKLTTMKTMPKQLAGHHYYHPTEQGRESRIKARMEQIQRWHQQHDPH